MIKKLSAVLLAVMMLFTMSFVASAEEKTGTIKLVMNPTDVYYDAEATEPIIFTVDVVVAGVTTIGALGVQLNYNPAIVVPVKADGEVATAIGEVITVHLDNWYQMGAAVNTTENFVKYPGVADSINGSTYVVDLPADGVAYSFRFKALAAGDTEITLSQLGTQMWDNSDGANTLVLTDATEELKILAKPVAPTAVINEPAYTGEVVEGGEGVTPSYVWNNGNQDEGADTTTGDASVVTWYAGDDEIGTTVADEAFVVPHSAVGKTLSYTVLPKIERQIAPEGTLSEKVTVGMVKAIDLYKPSVRSVTLPAKLDPTVAVEPTVELDNTYALAEDVSTYEWHVVEADSAEAAIAAISGENVVARTKAYAPLATDRDKYAVVVVTPVVTVAGDTRTGEVTSEAAAKITAEDPEINVSAIDVNATLRIKKKVSAAAATIDAKLPAGAVGVEEAVTTYTWYALAEYGAELTEEAQVGGNSAELLLTDEMKDKFIVLTIDYTNVLGYDAEPVVVEFVNAVKKASTNAPAVNDSPSLGGSGTVVTPPTEEPGEEPGTEPGEQPGDEPTVEPNEDPSGNAIANGAAAFTDVDKEAYAWAYEGIDTLAKAGVIKGMTETTFGPELTATNAQMIALAVRIAGLTAENATTEKVDAEHWVADEAAVADAKGILGVYGDKVEVEEAVSREVAFTLLYNALKAAGVELPEVAEAIEFTDAASIDANCVEAIDALVKAGIVDGMGDGTLAPKATLTRAQLAKILGLADVLITK